MFSTILFKIMKLNEKIKNLFQSNASEIDKIREELFSLYNISENKDLNFANSTVEENDTIAKWLNVNHVVISRNRDSESKNKYVFINETEKLSYLWQKHCQICGDLFPVVNLSARIKPHTRQIKNKEIRKAFKDNFSKSKSFENLEFCKNDKLCIKIVFVLNKEFDKDLDNMAKITLDCVKNLLKVDDKNIDHLDLIKIKTNYLESHIKFRISKSELNTKKDIVLTGTNLKWAVDKLD